jgi:PAS domain S-box-containing protein
MKTQSAFNTQSPAIWLLTLLALASCSVGIVLYLQPAFYLSWPLPDAWKPLLPHALMALAAVWVLLGIWRFGAQQMRWQRQQATEQKQAKLLQQAVDKLLEGAYDQAQQKLEAVPLATAQQLTALAERLQQDAQQAKAQRWHQETLVRLTDVLRKHMNIQALGQELLSQSIRQLGLAQGVLYMRPALSESGMQPVATFAKGTDAALEQALNSSNGLLMQLEKDGIAIYREDLPENFAAIKSGLGQAAPKALYMCPIVFEGTLIGAFELSAFLAIPASHRALLAELAEKSAATLYNLLQTTHTAQLLTESQALANEMKAQAHTIQRANEAMRLKDRAIYSSSSSIVIVDALAQDNPIIYVNPAFTLTTGYTEAEVLGKNCRFLQGPDRDQEGLVHLRHAMAEGTECKVILRNYRKDGSLFWNELNVTPVRDDKGMLTHYVGVQNDISDRMSLQEAEQKMREMNEQLEENVRARTQELEHTLEELQTTQYRMIQSEKLASMGQLVAGVAHEINTPLGAIKASVVNMGDSLPQAMESLPKLMAQLEGQAIDLFVKLIVQNAQNNETLSKRDERRIRKEMLQQLEALGIQEADEMARALFNAGIRAQVADWLPIIQHPNAEELLRTAYHFSQLRTNMNVIGHAVDKTRKTVYALKKYSHFQQEEEEAADWLDITDSLDVVLTMYHNQLKHGVELTTDIHALPKIKGYADELGQVWTNIIHNAAQAMQYNGKLHISTHIEGGSHAVVSIADNGPGIPPDVLPRIFDPFFTTKRQGEGTGLGLDICKKIVEKHGGTIRVDTGPEGTTFFISMPLEQMVYSAEATHAANDTVMAA